MVGPSMLRLIDPGVGDVLRAPVAADRQAPRHLFAEASEGMADALANGLERRPPADSLRQEGDARPAPRGSPRRAPRHSPGSWAPAPPSAPATTLGGSHSPTSGRADKSDRSWSGDSGAPCRDCAPASSSAPLPLVREAPFFDEVLGELQAHHQLADFRAGQDQLPLLRLGLRAQPALALLQEDPLPALQLVRRHLALPRHSIQGLTAQ